MKNRLLEDIGDSQSGVPARPVRRVQAVPPPQPTEAQPQPEPPRQVHVEPLHAQAAAGAPDTPARPRAGVWRSRAPSAAPPSQPLHADAPPASAPPPPLMPSPAPEPPRAAPHMSPEMASFSSREPDWSIPLQPEPIPWTERWGRKALGWTFGLGAAMAIAAGGAWMVHETQVESSLAVVADHTQAPASPAPPAVQAAAPVPEPAPEAEPDTAPPPPLRMLPRDSVAANPAAAPVDAPPVAAGNTAGAGAVPAPQQAARTDAEQDAATASALAAAAAAEAAPPLVKRPAMTKPEVKKPEVKRKPERRVATAPVKRTRTEKKKPAPKTVREPARERAQERVLARGPTPAVPTMPTMPTMPARSVPAEQPDPESPLAETLRMCRAAGYHATACLKRGCEATRFGLVCRG